MLTIMMLLTGMLSSLSTQDFAPSPISSVTTLPAAYQTTSSVIVDEHSLMSVYPAHSGNEMLNGLTLQDRIGKADHVHGSPYERVPAYMAGEEYRYENVNVGAYEQWIYYISVPASAGSFNLNGHEVPMNGSRILELLGSPDFRAEDGFGYEHDGQALKIFIDPSNGEVRSVDLFDNTSV